jgi:hypothetical protein
MLLSCAASCGEWYQHVTAAVRHRVHQRTLSSSCRVCQHQQRFAPGVQQSGCSQVVAVLQQAAVVTALQPGMCAAADRGALSWQQ